MNFFSFLEKKIADRRGRKADERNYYNVELAKARAQTELQVQADRRAYLKEKAQLNAQPINLKAKRLAAKAESALSTLKTKASSLKINQGTPKKLGRKKSYLDSNDALPAYLRGKP